MNDQATGSLPSAIARLYGGPLEDFIRSRDALAKELRSAGEREAASAVKGLRKPSRPAWALNRVVDRAPARLAALDAALAGLMDAHAGSGDVRAALTALRSAVRAFATAAAEEGRSAGFSLDSGDLSNAMLAVLGNPGSCDELRNGRLADVPAPGGLDFLTLLPVRPKLEVSGPPQALPPQLLPEEAAAAREQARLAAQALAEARNAADAAASALTEAESEYAAARERVRLAESELAAAQQRLEFARRKHEASAAELRRAEAASEEADQRAKGLGPE